MQKRHALSILMILLLTSCSLPVNDANVVEPVGETGNPAAVPSPAFVAGLPTPTALEVEVEEFATSTPEIETSPTITITVRPDIEETAIPVQASDVLTSTIQYGLQIGSPVAVPNFSRPDAGCNWMGIGGQVFGVDGQPLSFLVIEVGGSLDGEPISALRLTGSAPVWGPGGFEFTIANEPVASSGTMWIQIFDLDGTPISDRMYITTYEDCSQNAIVLNLVPSGPTQPSIQYFPWIPNDG